MNLSQYTKEFSYNLRLAYPVIIGMLGHTLIGIVDNIMVGKLGSTELAAVSLPYSLSNNSSSATSITITEISAIFIASEYASSHK